MRLAVVSDVHGHMAAFDAVLQDLEALRPDLVIHGGDLCFNGPRPAEVIDRVRDLGWEGVMGNTDQALWDAPAVVSDAFRARAARTRELIGPEREAWLRELPLEWRGPGVALVHAVPGDLWRLVPADAPDEALRDAYAPLGEPLAVYCHIHVPFVRRVGEITVANSGSVGLPADGDRRASYLAIEDGHAAVRRVEYDYERALADVRGSGYPAWENQVEMLREARFIPV